MEPGKNIRELSRYVELTGWIRELSSPQLTGLENAEDYRVNLLKNFKRIGDMSRTNNAILDDIYYPLLNSDIPLDEMTVETMRSFANEMLNAYTLENLDLPMMYLQAEKMLNDAESKGDEAVLIRALSDYIDAAYTMLTITQRLLPQDRVCLSYRDKGREACEKMLAFLAPEKFVKLPDDCKDVVLTISRYISAMYLYPAGEGTAKEHERDLQLIIRSLSFCEDPFYRENAPRYDWEYHKFRCLEYITKQAEENNAMGYTKEQLAMMRTYAYRLSDYFDAHKETLAAYTSRLMIDMYLARLDHLCGHIDTETYKEKLKVYMAEEIPEEATQIDATLQAFIIPVEYIMVLDKTHLTKEDEAFLRTFYRREVVDLHRLNKESLSFMLSYVADTLNYFIEVEDGMTFEEMCLSIMVALHPPTYVHTLSVADFTVCLTKHLIRKNPKLYVGFCGIREAFEVAAHEKEILDFAYHAALCHDVGKLYIIETIITYGRRLYDREFDLIKVHPVIGADLLTQHKTTKAYANIARGHHKWYDDSAGYPEAFSLRDAPEHVIIETVTCADCLDAATDAVGRSYKDGKTLEDFLVELKAGSGTRYAPYLDALFDDPEVKKDVGDLLVKCRDENYRKAYHHLKELEERNP